MVLNYKCECGDLTTTAYILYLICSKAQRLSKAKRVARDGAEEDSGDQNNDGDDNDDADDDALDEDRE